MAGSSSGHRYRPLPTSVMPEDETAKDTPRESAEISDYESRNPRWWTRDRYSGALLFNVCAFILPAIYATLSKLYIAAIDSSMVATTDTYTYISVIVEVINEGLPRAAYKVIGDRSRRSFPQRLGISYALIIFQAILGLVMSFAIFGAATRFTSAFVPIETREESVQYVRIAAFSSFFSAVDVAVSVSTRALDRPDVPLLISTVKTAINILLDLLFLSKFRVKSIDVDVTTQCIIRLCCDAAGAAAGFTYFLIISRRASGAAASKKPSFPGLKLLAKPGSYTFVESAIRNALYLWLVSGIVDLGKDYATAWGVFNTIRWGLVMVPVYSLEATSNTFVGHAWGSWKRRGKKRADKRDILTITRPALLSAGISIVIEVPLCLIMTFVSCEPFAYYLSQSHSVATITAYMWRTIDWCYIFYAVSTQLASILLATKPRWYLIQSLGSNIFWVLPWAIAVSRIHGPKVQPWKYYGIVFGGSMVVSFGIVAAVLTLWTWRLMRAPRSAGD